MSIRSHPHSHTGNNRQGNTSTKKYSLWLGKTFFAPRVVHIFLLLREILPVSVHLSFCWHSKSLVRFFFFFKLRLASYFFATFQNQFIHYYFLYVRSVVSWVDRARPSVRSPAVAKRQKLNKIKLKIFVLKSRALYLNGWLDRCVPSSLFPACLCACITIPSAFFIRLSIFIFLYPVFLFCQGKLRKEIFLWNFSGKNLFFTSFGGRKYEFDFVFTMPGFDSRIFAINLKSFTPYSGSWKCL